MLIISVDARAEARAKDLVMEVTDLLNSTSYPVFWYLSQPHLSRTGTALPGILRSLIYQALRHDPSITSQDRRLGDIRSFEGEHSTAEWIGLTCLVLSKIQHFFLVVEPEDMYHACERDGIQLQAMLTVFDQIFHTVTAAGTTMKLLFVKYGNQPSLSLSPGGTSKMMASVHAPLPVARRSRHSWGSQLRIGLGRNNLQPRLTATGRNCAEERRTLTKDVCSSRTSAAQERDAGSVVAL